MIGSQVQKDLFGTINPIGQELKLGAQRFTVIGVMEEKGNRMATEGWDERVIIPFTTMETYFFGSKKPGIELFIQAVSFDKVNQSAGGGQDCLAAPTRLRGVFCILHGKGDIEASWKREPDPSSLAWGSGKYRIICRRHRHYEHYAGVGNRAHKRNWIAESGRRATNGYFATVPD